MGEVELGDVNPEVQNEGAKSKCKVSFRLCPASLMVYLLVIG